MKLNILYLPYTRKPQKSRPTSAGLVRKSRDPCRGKKDKDEDLYNMVEHRLPRMGIQELLQGKVVIWKLTTSFNKILKFLILLEPS